MSRVLPTNDNNETRDLSVDVHISEDSRIYQRFAALGLVYVVGSKICSYIFLTQLEPYVQNDYWWEGFNTTGVQTYLGDLFNSRLLWNRWGSLSLVGNSSCMTKYYGSPTTEIEWSVSYGRQLLLNAIPLADAILALRGQSVDANFRMVSPYCWLDLNRTYQMAHTYKRQIRCEKSQTQNAAMYLEALLRNTNSLSTSSYSQPFNMTIFTPLKQTQWGQDWIQALEDHVWQPIDIEISIWNEHGLTEWYNQYQNLNHDGIDDSIIIYNALGYQQTIRIKKTSTYVRGVGMWSTQVAAIGIWNDAFLCQMLGCNLLLNTNESAPALGLDWDLDMLSPPSTRGGDIIRKYIGPFTSIDIKYVPRPTDLIAFNVEHQYLFYQDVFPIGLGTIVLDPVPPSWRSEGRLYFGGNPLCPFGSAQSFVQRSFGYYDTCAEQVSDTIILSPESAFFAMQFLAQEPSHQTTTICSTCASTTTECVSYLELIRVHSNKSMQNISRELIESTSALNISILQMVADGGEDTLLVQPLISSESWTFFGFVMLHDWLQGFREVCDFEGDNGSYRLMGNYYPHVSMAANPLELPQHACDYIWYTSLYISFVVGALGVVVVIYVLVARLDIVGMNLFQINRVLGCVWISRPLLFLRGMTAIVVLSTAAISFEHKNSLTSLEFTPRSIWISSLLSGEAMWLIYVLHDFCLPFIQGNDKYLAPISSIVTWCLFIAWDQFAPVTITALIEPQCNFIRLGLLVECQSGSVSIGNVVRLGCLCMLILAVPLVTFCLTIRYRRSSSTDSDARDNINILIPASAASFCQLAQGWPKDHATLAMCGILVFREYALDIKLWRILYRNHQFEKTQSFVGLKIDENNKTSLRLHFFGLALVGLLYMVATVVGSFSYIQITESTMSNDLWWPDFNSSRHQSFLSNWYNGQMQLTREEHGIRLDSPEYADEALDYRTAKTTIPVAMLYAASIQDEVNTIENVIIGLRGMNSCLVPWISTSYCYLDFDQNWEMASSTTRQQNCLAKLSNGAVYLESHFRNADWDNLSLCWGTSLEIGIFSFMKTFNDGRKWLEKVKSNALSVSDEVAHWKSHGINEYITDWQNYKQFGMEESFSIQNSFGSAFSFTIKKIKPIFQLASPTSFRFQWPLALFLRKLEQNSSIFFETSLIKASGNGLNSSLENMFIYDGFLASPWTHAASLTRDILGPFGDVGSKRIAPPAILASMYKLLTKTILVTLSQSDDAKINYESIPVLSTIFAVPTQWAAWDHLGGDIFCEYVADIGVNIGSFFRSDGTCAYGGVDPIRPPRMNSIAAFLAIGIKGSDPCALEIKAPNSCLKMQEMSIEFLNKYISVDNWNAIRDDALKFHDTIKSSGMPQLVQYIGNDNDDLVLSTIDLFDTTSFEFFAWLYAFEWLAGIREVVEFSGPAGSLLALSAQMTAASMIVNSQEISQNVAFYIRCAVQYMTVVLFLVALLTSISILVNRGFIEGMNMFQFNRVAGLVWLGRPLLVLRGITAMSILSTSTLTLESSPIVKYTKLNSRPPNVITTLLSSGEMGWFVYVLNDIFSIVTQGYTYNYPWKSSMLAWTCASIWGLAIPVEHTATINRICTLPSVDFETKCESGIVEIGRSDRFWAFIMLAVGCCILCYAYERLRNQEIKVHCSSLFLHTSAQYQFDRVHWQRGKIYYLDRASAILNGLLALRLHGTLFLFDIKTWRLYSISPNSFENAELQKKCNHLSHAIPLGE